MLEAISWQFREQKTSLQVFLGILVTGYKEDIFQYLFPRAHLIICLFSSLETEVMCYFWEPHFFWKRHFVKYLAVPLICWVKMHKLH